MPEEQKAQSKPKSQGPFFISETKGSTPPEPVNMIPFTSNPKPVKKGLLPPPAEPVNISPFPVQRPKPKSSSSET
jgi:hypothetical protein